MKIPMALVSILVLTACTSTRPSTDSVQPAPVVELNTASPAPKPEAAPVNPAPSVQPRPIPVATENVASPPPGSLASRDDVQAFIREMHVKHDFGIGELNALFGRARARPDIIAAITRPAEAKPWSSYRKIFLTRQRISGGVAFWRKHQAVLTRAEEGYGVPAEIIVAIIGVETMYGGNMGKHTVLEALATLAFDYPRRAPFFRKELESYLILTRRERIDPLSLKGSYAGAMGFGQFMPSSYINYAVDFDGDRRRDLWRNPEDAIGSVANYLSGHQWQQGEPIVLPASVEGDQYQASISRKLSEPRYTVAELRQRGVTPRGPVAAQQRAMLLKLAGAGGPEHWLGFANFYVITRYNHSALYAMAVYQLSQEIRGRFAG